MKKTKTWKFAVVFSEPLIEERVMLDALNFVNSKTTNIEFVKKIGGGVFVYFDDPCQIFQLGEVYTYFRLSKQTDIKELPIK